MFSSYRRGFLTSQTGNYPPLASLALFAPISRFNAPATACHQSSSVHFASIVSKVPRKGVSSEQSRQGVSSWGDFRQSKDGLLIQKLKYKDGTVSALEFSEVFIRNLQFLRRPVEERYLQLLYSLEPGEAENVQFDFKYHLDTQPCAYSW